MLFHFRHAYAISAFCAFDGERALPFLLGIVLVLAFRAYILASGYAVELGHKHSYLAGKAFQAFGAPISVIYAIRGFYAIFLDVFLDF